MKIQISKTLLETLPLGYHIYQSYVALHIKITFYNRKIFLVELLVAAWHYIMWISLLCEYLNYVNLLNLNLCLIQFWEESGFLGEFAIPKNFRRGTYENGSYIFCWIHYFHL